VGGIHSHVPDFKHFLGYTSPLLIFHKGEFLLLQNHLKVN